MKTNRRIFLALALLGVMLVQNAQAFYNPSTGRWLSRDPIGEKGGVNLFGFAFNRPTSLWDKLGKCVTTTGGKKAFGGGFRFDADPNFADVNVEIEDKDYCQAEEMSVVFNFLTDYDETKNEDLEKYAEFTCNGEKATPSEVGNPPPDSDGGTHPNGKNWSVTCKLKLAKCSSTGTGVTLGFKGPTDSGGMVNGSVNATVNYTCDCPCKINGCINVSLSATGNKK